MERINPQFIVDREGKKTAAVIPIEEYEELIEDLHDLAIIAERRDEASITFDELKETLRNDGLL
ncbi:hypothetical protein ISS30_09485 [bacterium]|nr:hypothetical protein [FCB group bacterium]MBL7191918.1 hypothetical protein [bacterium]